MTEFGLARSQTQPDQNGCVVVRLNREIAVLVLPDDMARRKVIALFFTTLAGNAARGWCGSCGRWVGVWTGFGRVGVLLMAGSLECPSVRRVQRRSITNSDPAMVV